MNKKVLKYRLFPGVLLRFWLMVLSAVSVVLLPSCAQTMRMKSSFSESVHLKNRVSPCRLHVTSLQDDRKCRESIGRIAGRNIKAEDVVAWVRSGLKAFEIVADSEVETPTGGVAIAITIKKVQGRSISTSMSATVALYVQFMLEGRVVKEGLYRGNQTQINMISGDGEIHSCFDHALKKTLEQIYKDAVNLCQ